MATATLASASPHAGKSDRWLNIHETSTVCGLSASVLRIWEIRYGWPSPKRLANGYRCYSPLLVEDLQRMANLVKSGIPIRQLVADGLPCWPRDPASPMVSRTASRSRSLPVPADRQAALLQHEVIEALEAHRSGSLRMLLERSQIELRPKDEPLAILLPLLVGLDELTENGRPLGPAEEPLRTMVANRAMQLLRRQPQSEPELHAVPTTPAATAAALVAALLLSQAARPTRIWLEGAAQQPPGSLVAHIQHPSGVDLYGSGRSVRDPASIPLADLATAEGIGRA